MAETITVNAVTTLSIPRDEVEWSESAFLGEVGQGRFTVHDTAGTVDIPAHKAISVEQSSSTPARIFTGYVGRKRISRGQSQNVSAAREIVVETRDLNDLLGRYVITGTDGKRSAETVAARLTWLLASTYLSTLVADRGAVTSVTTVGMDATDYRGQRPGDVLAACATAASMNYYVRYHASGPELVFRDDNNGTDDTCTLSISNVASDVNLTTVFPPAQGAELTQDGDDVYSGVHATYSKGSVYETRAATATAFAARDGVTSDSGIKNASTARTRAKTFLWESHTEEQMLPVTLRLPASKVGLVQAGQRISTRMSHLAVEGWDPARYARILRKRITQPQDTDNDYDVTLDLSPQEAAETFPAAYIVQSAFGNGADGGCELTLANPVTIGNLLVVWVSARNKQYPIGPNVDASKPRWGAGAWTRLNGASATATLEDGYDGCAMYYKTADATTQAGFYAESNCNIGIWEIAGGNIAAATLVTKNEQSGGGPTYTIGNLGTAAVGSVALLGILSNGPAGYQAEYSPLVAVTPGVWTERWYHGAYRWTFFDGPGYYGPMSWIGDTLGAGAALSAGITRTPVHWTSPYFAGLGLLIPAL